MTKYEVYDDEVGEDETVETDAPVEVVTEEVVPTHPFGTFSREFSGRKIWFHGLSPTQMAALRRLFETTQKRIRKVTPDEAGQIVYDFNNSSLVLIEAMILNEDDVDFLRDSMLSGDIEVNEVIAVLWPSKTPDDDEDPEPVVKAKAKPAKASKAVANAARTKR